MSSVIVELQKDVLDRSLPLSDLLRKALIIARKLNIKEFETWTSSELNGYGDGQEIPKYRTIHGEIKGHNPYHGWQPVIFPDTTIAEKLSTRPCNQTIAEMESLIKKDKNGASLYMPFSKYMEKKFMDALEIPVEVTLVVPMTEVIRILDVVRTILLNWSLKLEEDGVKGEGLTFTTQEKQAAEKQSYNINNFYGPVNSPQIQQQTNHSIQISNYSNGDVEEINTFIKKLQSEVTNLTLQQDKVAELRSEIDTVESQTRSPKPKQGIIKQGLSSIRTILEGAGGHIAAQLIIEVGKLLAK